MATNVTALNCFEGPIGGAKLSDLSSAENRMRSAALGQGGSGNIKGNVANDCGSGISNPDRFVSCASEQWNLADWVMIDGQWELDGNLPILFKSSVEFDENGLTGVGPTWKLSVELDTGVAYGPVDGTWASTIKSGCEAPEIGSGAACGSNGENTFSFSIAPKSSYSFEWRQQDTGFATHAGNVVDTLLGRLGGFLTVNGPWNPVDFNDASVNTLWGRCDSVNVNVACVDDKAPVSVSFNGALNDKIKPVAEHVFDAEATPPSHWGNPNYGAASALHRTLDQTIEASNRTVACANVPPSCDEYPMAATLEGASRSAPGNWSAVTVPVSANSAQGGTMTTFYAYDRVIDNDPYFVLAVKGDGTPSW